MIFKFPLQKVLDHRKIKETLAKKEFQEVMAVLNEETSRLDFLEQQKNEAHIKAGQIASQGGSAGPSLVQIFEFIKGQEILIQRQKQKIQETEKLVEAKREILRQTTQEYKIMVRTREKQFEEYKLERLAEDQKEMDEQTILRFKGSKET